jgi:hypothetical protein
MWDEGMVVVLVEVGFLWQTDVVDARLSLVL